MSEHRQPPAETTASVRRALVLAGAAAVIILVTTGVLASHAHGMSMRLVLSVLGVLVVFRVSTRTYRTVLSRKPPVPKRPTKVLRREYSPLARVAELIAFVLCLFLTTRLVVTAAAHLEPSYRGLVGQLPPKLYTAVTAGLFVGAVVVVSLLANAAARLGLNRVARWEETRRGRE